MRSLVAWIGVGLTSPTAGLLAFVVAGSAAVGTWYWPTVVPARSERLILLVAVLGIVLGLLMASPVAVAVAPLAAGMAIIERRRRVASHRLSELRSGLPVLVDAMTQQLRSGLSLREVCRRPPDTSPILDEAFAPLADGLARDRSLVESIDQLRSGSFSQSVPEMELLAAALSTLAEHGGPAIPALQRLRLTLVGTVQAQAEAKVQAAQALTSAGLLVVAPGMFAVVVALVDPRTARFYLTDVLGAVCVVLSLLLSYGGWRWMEAKVKRALHPGSRRNDVGR